MNMENIILNNTDNPIKDKLVAKQKLVRKKQFAMDKLLDVYLEGSLSKKRYQARTDKLEAEMNRHKAEEATLQADLEAKTELDALYHNLDQYIDEVSNLLTVTDNNHDKKKEFLQRLGIGVHMHTDNTSRFVDWSIFDNFNVRNGHHSRFVSILGGNPASKNYT